MRFATDSCGFCVKTSPNRASPALCGSRRSESPTTLGSRPQLVKGRPRARFWGDYVATTHNDHTSHQRVATIHRKVRRPKSSGRTFVVSFVAAERRGNGKRRGCRESTSQQSCMNWGRTGGQSSEETGDPSRIRCVFIRAGARPIEAFEAADGYVAYVQRRLFGAAL